MKAHRLVSRMLVKAHAAIQGVEKTPVFVVGTQRSGTTLLIDILGKSPLCQTFHEVDDRAMQDVRLRDEPVIKQLIQDDGHPLLIFKPINDSQYSEAFINTYDNSRIVWLYRDYNDVVNSALVKWAEWQKKIVLWVREHYGDQDTPTDEPEKWLAIYRERITPETVEALRRCADDELTNAEGAALLWYMRNQLYFDQQLEDSDKVLLVRYEDMVRDPMVYIKRVFDFIGCPFKNNYAADVRTSSIAKKDQPELRPSVRDLCNGLQQKLDAVYKQKRGDLQ
ncbi:MAG TPA: sulfotransferase [Gammaproteobacteria bacterium]|nr:sulfotransferase [Gammaproteobacteria bacterium]